MHPSQVDHEAALRQGSPRDAVPAAADRDLEAEVASEPHRAHDIMHVGALGDDAGPAIDHRVEDRARLLVGGVAGDDDLPCKTPTELVKSGAIGVNGHLPPPLEASVAEVPEPRCRGMAGRATVYAVLADSSLDRSSPLKACDVATACARSAWSRRDARSRRRDPLPGGSRRRCARAG